MHTIPLCDKLYKFLQSIEVDIDEHPSRHHGGMCEERQLTDRWTDIPGMNFVNSPVFFPTS